MTESPQPPQEPNEGEEVRCPGCGRWNDSNEKRCAHCGRSLSERSSGWVARREAEEAEALPPAEEAGPPPPPEPEWKKELKGRLEGYRQRQETDGDEFQFVAGAPRRQLATRRQYEDRPPLRLPARRTPLPRPERQTGTLPPSPRSLAPRPTAIEERVAPLSLRAVAGLLDLALVTIALGVFVGVGYWLRPEALDREGVVQMLGGAFFCLLVFYWIFFLKYLGRTAGMNWMGLRVLNFDGEPPTPAQRRNRAFGAVLSTAALGLGFAWAAADEQRFTWHDRMSKTFIAIDEPED